MPAELDIFDLESEQITYFDAAAAASLRQQRSARAQSTLPVL